MEIAPTMYGDWESLFSGAAKIDIVPAAIQSCFFNTKHNLYSGPDEWVQHLNMVAGLARSLGCFYLVVGSPGARFAPAHMLGVPGELSAADRVLANVLAKAADSNKDIFFGLEANPVKYGANTATDAASAIRIAESADRSNICFHIDTGCLRVAGDDPVRVLSDSAAIIKRGHVSMPDLLPYDGSEREFIRKALQLGIGLSYEARPSATGEDGAARFLQDVEAAL